jgi:hypothetical protein
MYQLTLTKIALKSLTVLIPVLSTSQVARLLLSDSFFV